MFLPTTTKFDFTKLANNVTNAAKNKRRSKSLTDDVEKVFAFRRACRKYTISTEVAIRLAEIGDEIMRDHASLFENFNVASLYQFFNANMGVKRRRGFQATNQNTTSNRRKISGYLGLALLFLITQI